MKAVDRQSRILTITLYDKDEMDDLTPKQREVLKQRVKGELKMRRQP
jgi:hypothetical protein